MLTIKKSWNFIGRSYPIEDKGATRAMGTRELKGKSALPKSGVRHTKGEVRACGGSGNREIAVEHLNVEQS